MGLLDVGASWITSMALFSRIFGYLDLPVDVAPPRHPVALDVASLRGDVRFEQVLGVAVPGSASFYDEELRTDVARLYAEDLEAYGYALAGVLPRD